MSSKIFLLRIYKNVAREQSVYFCNITFLFFIESVWIGLHQDDEHGVFVQGNGGLIQFQTFVGDEPNNKGVICFT